jgi:hypothetical protein
MGGHYTFNGGSTDTAGTVVTGCLLVRSFSRDLPASAIFSIPLNTTFPVNGALSSNNYWRQNAFQQWDSQGTFFQEANVTMLYSLGVYPDDSQSPMDNLKAYNITSNKWSNITVSGGNFNYDTRVAMSSAVTAGTSAALGFASGGWDDLGGMTRFDASNPETPKWTNETDSNPPLSYEGSMSFMRLGPKDSLISFGGYNKDHIDRALRPGLSYDRRSQSENLRLRHRLLNLLHRHRLRRHPTKPLRFLHRRLLRPILTLRSKSPSTVAGNCSPATTLQTHTSYRSPAPNRSMSPPPPTWTHTSHLPQTTTQAAITTSASPTKAARCSS